MATFSATATTRNKGTTAMTTPQAGYGTIEEGAADRSFDVAETYYLKESRLSPEERRRKVVSLVVPLLAAVMIVGGAAFFLLKDFGHLYPGSHGDPREYNMDNHDYPVPPPSPTEKSNSEPAAPQQPTQVDSGTAGSSKCADIDKCDKLGLLGECCPTLDGTFLNCCH